MLKGQNIYLLNIYIYIYIYIYILKILWVWSIHWHGWDCPTLECYDSLLLFMFSYAQCTHTYTCMHTRTHVCTHTYTTSQLCLTELWRTLASHTAHLDYSPRQTFRETSPFSQQPNSYFPNPGSHHYTVAGWPLRAVWHITPRARPTFITEATRTFTAILFLDAWPVVINPNHVNSIHNPKPEVTLEAGCPQGPEQSHHNSAWAPTMWTEFSPPVGRACRKPERKKGLAFQSVKLWYQPDANMARRTVKRLA